MRTLMHLLVAVAIGCTAVATSVIAQTSTSRASILQPVSIEHMQLNGISEFITKNNETYRTAGRKKFVSGRRAGIYQVYVTACLNQIFETANHLRPISGMGHHSGSVLITFSVQSSGKLTAVDIDRASGHAAIDKAMVEVIGLAAPFSPFPEDMRTAVDEISITDSFAFSPNRPQSGTDLIAP